MQLEFAIYMQCEKLSHHIVTEPKIAQYLIQLGDLAKDVPVQWYH